MTGRGLLDSILQDARFSLRGMRGSPVVIATSLVTLALAIGGNTAMFTVIRAVLLNPLQYPDADRLVSISGGATPTRFAEMRAGAHSFSELGAFVGPENVTLSGGAEPEVLKGVRVSADFLKVPAARPMIGRSFRAVEDSAGGAPVAMISAELWERRFGADPHVAGKTAILASTAFTIIGVLPPHFEFPLPGLDVWMTAPSEEPLIPPKSRALSPYLTVFGRLKPGVSIEQANAEMKVIRHQYALAHPSMLDAKPKPVEVAAMKDELVAKVKAMLWMLFGAVGLVLLIACANIAGLLIARASARTREFAVRAALGAGRGRLIRQLLVESVLLSLGGGALGVLLAAWALEAIGKLTALDLPRAGEIQMNWTVLGFSAALSIATGILFGLAPSLGASRPDLMAALRASGEAGRQGAPRRILAILNIRALLVIGQIALSIVLLIGAALLVESIAHLRHVDVGFNPSHLLTMRVTLPPLRYDTDQKKNAFYDDLLQHMEALPGVPSGAAASILPMMGQPGTPVQNAAQPLLKLNQRPIEGIISVTPGYFRTLEIPLKRGRDFNAQDRADSERVTVIDESAARQFWPAYPRGVDPVGQRLVIGGINPKPAAIVGIVQDVRQGLEGNAWPGTVYVAFSQGTPQSALFAIRTQGSPLTFTRSLRQQMRLLDSEEPLANVQTMDDLVEAQVGQRRLLMILLETFAGAALFLALIGIYGVTSYTASQRTKEVGIRRALGAQQSDILWLVTRQGVGLALAGIVLGLGGAAALTRLADSLLYGISATDPATFAGIAALFLVIALAAGYIPARRASRIDPMAALRQE
ncbi:MAG TPA: ABC transporter permease [Bryobacteraceae bacterium]|nr:ABC transporter permease [Bryobacteraceae bacterium]